MKSQNQKALSLIEFILALSIFATISITLYATFFNGIQISKKAKNFEIHQRQIRFAIDTLQADIDNMILYQTEDQGKPIPTFIGNNETLSFIIPTDNQPKKVKYLLASPQESSIHLIQLGPHTAKNVKIQTGDIKSPHEEFFLLRQEQGWDNTISNEILSKHALKNGLRFSYGYSDNNTLKWKNDWNDLSLPVAIKIELSYLNPDNPKTPLNIIKIIPIPLGNFQQNIENNENQQ